jgi:hypothetical protein
MVSSRPQDMYIVGSPRKVHISNALLSYHALSEPDCTLSELHCTLLSYTAPNCATQPTLHPTELR